MFVWFYVINPTQTNNYDSVASSHNGGVEWEEIIDLSIELIGTKFKNKFGFLLIALKDWDPPPKM